MNWENKLREIKEKLNLKTSELARLLDVTPQYLVDIEKGRIKKPTEKLIKPLLVKLNINPHWLFDSEGDMILNGIQNNSMSYNDALNLLQNFSELDADNKIKILEIMDKMRNG